ncbi:MAG: putative dehydrogenase, partial [Planctomycetota bacterium]
DGDHGYVPSMPMPHSIDRRQLLRRSLQVGAAAPFATPLVWGLGGRDRGDQVNLAVLGSGGRGRQLGKQFAQAGALVSVMCDVDSKGLDRALATVSEHQETEPQRAADYRHVLEDKSVDAVVIATPDHWHVPMAIAALQAGKHVYLEKPMAHNPHEGELMVQASKKYGLGVQFGIQRRSSVACGELISRLHAGVVGELSFARGWYARKRKSIGRGKEIAIPKTLDFDLWQGPAPRTQYRDNLLPYNWHWFWDWGTGELGNNGPHALDLCRWGLGVQGHPQRVTSGGGTYSHRDDMQTPDTQVVTYDYGKVGITFEHRNWHGTGLYGSSFGVVFYGSKGSATTDGNGYRIYDEQGELLEEVAGNRGDVEHTADFLRRVREGDRSTVSIEEGHRSSLLCHLGNIAFRTGHQLNCDPATGRILDDPAAQVLWRREYESGWEPKI